MTVHQTLLPPGWPRPRGYANGVLARGAMVLATRSKAAISSGSARVVAKTARCWSGERVVFSRRATSRPASAGLLDASDCHSLMLQATGRDSMLPNVRQGAKFAIQLCSPENPDDPQPLLLSLLTWNPCA